MMSLNEQQMQQQQNNLLIQDSNYEEGNNNANSSDHQNSQRHNQSEDIIQRNDENLYQIQEAADEQQMLNEEALNTLNECWGKTIRENEDLKRAYSLNKYTNFEPSCRAEISHEDPKLMVVYGPQFCRLLDLSNSSTQVFLHNIQYQPAQQLLHSASFESDFLVTVVSNKHISQPQQLLKNVGISLPEQQTFIELRRVRNVGVNQASDFVQVPMRPGVKVARVRVCKVVDAADGVERAGLFILRADENIVEVKVIELNGRIISLSNIHFVSVDTETGRELKLDDLHLFTRRTVSGDKLVTNNWIALNYSQYTFSIMTVDDLLLQRGLGGTGLEQKFDPNVCQSLRLFQLSQYNQFGQSRSTQSRVTHVDSFRLGGSSTELLILARQSSIISFLSPHELDVIDLSKGELVISAPINLPDITQRQVFAEQKPWLRRLLDCYSSDKGFYVLVQDLSYLYIYMIHPNTREIQTVQVNRSQVLEKPSISDELLTGTIIRRSVDLPTLEDVSLSVMLLGSCGTQVVELDISYQYDATLQKFADLNLHHLLDSQQNLKLFTATSALGAANNFNYNNFDDSNINYLLFKNSNLNDISSSSLNVNNQQQQQLTSDIGGDLATTLIKHRQFKKLAEVVLMRSKSQTMVAMQNQGLYVFTAMGKLRKILKEEVESQRISEIKKILSMAVYIQSTYVPGESNFPSLVQTRQELLTQINLELRRIEGLCTVFKAVLKRQIEQAQETQMKTRGNKMRESDLLEIKEIRRYLIENVEKQSNLLRVLLFFIESDYLAYLFRNYDTIKSSYDLQQADQWCLPQLNDLTISLFNSNSSLPLLTLRDHVNLVDSAVLPKTPLQLIYYQVLDLCSVLNSRKVESNFCLTLGGVFGEGERRAVKAIWEVDNCQNIANGRGGSNDYKIIEELARYKDQLGHLDHLVFKKFQMTVSKEIAVHFLTNGACRSPIQLSNYQALRSILEFFISCQQQPSSFIELYLKDCENEIKDENLYKQLMQDYLSAVISKGALQRDLFEVNFSSRQQKIMEELLEQKYPNLLVSFKLYHRQISQALGLAIKVGGNSDQFISARSETGKLARDYMATLTKDQQKLAYQESRLTRIDASNFYSEMKTQFNAASQVRPGVNYGLASKIEGRGNKIFYEPASDLQQQVSNQQSKSQKQQVPSSFKTFNDFFGFNNVSQTSEIKPIVKQEELLLLPSASANDFEKILSYEEKQPVSERVKLFYGLDSIPDYHPPIIHPIASSNQSVNVSHRGSGDDEEMHQDPEFVEEDQNNNNNASFQFLTDNQGNMPHQRASEQRQLPSVGLDHYLEINAGAGFSLPTPLQTQRMQTFGSSDDNQGILHQHTEENLLDDHSLERQLGEAPFADDDDIEFENQAELTRLLSNKKRSADNVATITTTQGPHMNIQEYEVGETSSALMMEDHTIIQDQKRKSRMPQAAADLSSISEIHEGDSQSNIQRGLQGSMSGSGMNQSYIIQGSGSAGQMIVDKMEHRLSMDAAAGQNFNGQSNTFNMNDGTPFKVNSVAGQLTPTNLNLANSASLADNVQIINQEPENQDEEVAQNVEGDLSRQSDSDIDSKQGGGDSSSAN